MTRSLVLKIYLFAVLALVGLGLLSFLLVRLLVDQTNFDALREIGTVKSGYLAREAEAALAAGTPLPPRLRQLGEKVGARVGFVPWKRAVTMHPGLRGEAIVVEKTGRKGLRAWRYWARVERGGQPVGAIRVELRRPFTPSRHRPWVGAAVMIVVVGLITVPPLIVWVVMPLRRMEAVARRLGEGHLDEPVPVGRRDEFGNLERAFEGLRVRILQMLHQRDRLLTDISHELRGPLSRMAIAVPLARSSLGGDHPASPYLDQVEQDMKTMDELIGELLAFARGRTPVARRDEALDLADLARQALADRAIVASGRSVVPAAHLGFAPVAGDARLLGRALGNLLDNALKYGPEGGILAVSTGQEGAEAVFRVRDEGPGIPEADLPHVFEPFYRPDTARAREAGGTGLGLAIVKAVAESHGGTAVLTPASGGGLLAELRLPLRA